jgi:Chlorite dismutase
MPKSDSAGPIDVSEHGAERDGKPQVMDRRLFMQLLVFACDGELSAGEGVRRLAGLLENNRVGGVIYEDVNHPRGLALLTWSEDASHFVERVRPLFAAPELRLMRVRPEFTMFGRSYSSGFEPDLAYWLLERPRETALNRAWPWAVWYPLRRGGAFERLEGRERGSVLREHAEIGKAYGAADLAHDIRLACHGLDANDNEFVIGLVGSELHPLSHVVQSMRKTRQTSEFIVQMGPFFVGHAAWQNRGA